MASNLSTVIDFDQMCSDYIHRHNRSRNQLGAPILADGDTACVKLVATARTTQWCPPLQAPWGTRRIYAQITVTQGFTNGRTKNINLHLPDGLGIIQVNPASRVCQRTALGSQQTPQTRTSKLYEGEFVCRVYPTGKIGFSGEEYGSGASVDVQDMIRILSNDPYGSVFNFKKDASGYYWTVEGDAILHC